YRNLFLTMAIGGLWHGANWTYLVWGCFHGVLLLIERFFKAVGVSLGRMWILKWIITFFLVNVGWVFFRAPHVSTAIVWLQKAFFLTSTHTYDTASILSRNKDRFFAALIIGLLAALLMKNTWQFKYLPSKGRAILLGFLFAICLMYMGEESPFLYFQF
ncbi:MAG TPA: hypothetical protein VN132_10690, partial [Bdellovibrio sp.]|nr:hypothetical protein [Bdellovibrio sp.]